MSYKSTLKTEAEDEVKLDFLAELEKIPKHYLPSSREILKVKVVQDNTGY